MVTDVHTATPPLLENYVGMAFFHGIRRLLFGRRLSTVQFLWTQNSTRATIDAWERGLRRGPPQW